MQNYSFVYFNL